MGGSRLVLLVLATAVASGAAGYVRGARAAYDQGYVVATLESDVDCAAVAVTTLRAAERNDLGEATGLLEGQVDTAIVRMSRYGHMLDQPFYAPEDRGMRAAVLLLARELAKHRKSHRRDSDPKKDAEIRNAAERLASAP